MEEEDNGLGQAGVSKEGPDIPAVVMMGLRRSVLMAVILLFKRGIRMELDVVLVLVIVVMMRDVKDRFHIFQAVKR